MKKALLYIHGKGGNSQEANHYQTLLGDYKVVGLDYKGTTPWDTKEEFLNAYGGSDNVLEVAIERQKITVKVKDIDKVQGEELKNLGASGVLLIGNEVRASFSDRAQYVYDLIK